MSASFINALRAQHRLLNINEIDHGNPQSVKLQIDRLGGGEFSMTLEFARGKGAKHEVRIAGKHGKSTTYFGFVDSGRELQRAIDGFFAGQAPLIRKPV